MVQAHMRVTAPINWSQPNMGATDPASSSQKYILQEPDATATNPTPEN
jgi:hypothetical protein